MTDTNDAARDPDVDPNDDDNPYVASDGETFDTFDEMSAYQATLDSTGIPCPRCGALLDDAAERGENLCRPCMLELMDITPAELATWLNGKYPQFAALGSDDTDEDKTLVLTNDPTTDDVLAWRKLWRERHKDNEDEPQ